MPDLAGKKILLIRPDRLGDVILSIPVAIALKKVATTCHITFLVKKYALPIIEACADVNDGFALNEFLRSSRKLRIKKIVRFLQLQHFDIAIHLHPRPELALATWLARIPVRIGTGYRFYSFFFNHRHYEHRKAGLCHEAEYNLQLLQPLGLQNAGVEFSLRVDPDAMTRVKDLLQSENIAIGEPLVILHPGSGGSARDWPLASYAKLADRLLKEQKARVVITGIAEESQILANFYSHSELKPPSLAGRLNLKELAALLQLADVFVSNSTGPLHLAVALGTEVVAFYPPIRACRPERWGPYNRRKDVLMSQDEECRRCTKRYERYCACMAAIPVQAAYDKISEKLSCNLKKDQRRSKYLEGFL